MNNPTRRPAPRPRVFHPADSVSQSEPASPHRAGHYAGLHAEDAPRTTTGEVSRKLVPRSAYRYTPIDDFIEQAETIAMPDGVMYRQGNEQVYVN